MDFSLWDHGLTFVCWREEFWQFYIREVAVLLSSPAGVRADLVGFRKSYWLQGYKEYGQQQSRDQQKHTTVNHRYQPTVSKHIITGSIVMSNEPHVLMRWVQLWVATFSVFLLHFYCFLKSDINRVIFNNQRIQLKNRSFLDIFLI